ncbi:hypothetical protein P8452_28610 [Trifolium repens]|nr:hypothetical protein P8452_28610 [Trifolium repens]
MYAQSLTRCHTHQSFQAALGNKFLPRRDGMNEVLITLHCKSTDRDNELYEITSCMDNEGFFYIDCPNQGSCGPKFLYVTYLASPQQLCINPPPQPLQQSCVSPPPPQPPRCVLHHLLNNVVLKFNRI